jgi:hypothetical protein
VRLTSPRLPGEVGGRCRGKDIGRVRAIKDVLPAPDDVVPREGNVKVMLSLSRRRRDFFKAGAARYLPALRVSEAAIVVPWCSTLSYTVT